MSSLWPVHLHPQRDEQFSSWLLRLAHGHGMRVHAFTEMMLGRGLQVWTRDIDRCADERLIALVADRTATPRGRAYQTTIAAYEGVVFERHTPNGNTPWVLPLGIYHRTRRRFGQQFCPRCLFFDSEPYYRRQWRLAFATVCESHGTLLHDRCYECAAPVVFFRGDIRPHRTLTDPMVTCWKCGADLRRAPTRPPHWPDWETTTALRSLLTFIDSGWAVAGAHFHPYAHLFLDLLHAVATVLARRRTRAARLVTVLERKLGLPFPALPDTARRFEHLSVMERHQVLMFSLWMLMDWPARFVALGDESGVTWSVWGRDVCCLPWWFESEVRFACSRGSYAPNESELSAVADALRHRELPVSRRAVCQEIGKTGARAAVRFRASTSRVITEEELKQLLSALAAAAQECERGSMRRLLLLRDRAIFGVMAFSRLSCSAVLRMSVADAIALMRRRSLERTTASRLSNFILLYLRDVRPHMVRSMSGSCLFLGATGDLVQSKAIALRFRRALNLSGMNTPDLTLSSLRHSL